MKTRTFLANHGYKICPICGEVETIEFIHSNGVCRNCMREVRSLLCVEDIENIEMSEGSDVLEENLISC